MSCLSQTESQLSPQTSTVLIQRHLGNDNWLSEFTNEFNEVRLRRVKGLLNLNDSLDVWKLTQLYQEWVLDDNEIVIKGTNRETEEVRYIAVKAAKRGNDIDAFRIASKLITLRDNILPYIHTGAKIRHTNAIYVTGTVDPRLVDYDLEYAWMYMGVWFNRFMAHLRKKLTCITAEISDENGHPKVREVRTSPKILILRSWESHESGWPHFHAILCIEWGVRGQPHWDVFQDKGCWKDGHWVLPRWRVKDKHILDECWPYGWLDAIALTAGTLEKSLEDVIWYVGKNLSSMDYRLISRWPRKRILTQSILWYFRKRSFAVSRALARPSQDDLIKRTCVIQTDLDGNELDDSPWEWELVGLIRRKDTELHRDDWAKVYVEPPDWLDQVWKPNERYEGEWWGKALHHNPNASVPWGSP